MEIQDFIQNVMAGNAADAKENLNDILSARAFETLEAKKKDISKTLFGGSDEQSEDELEIEVQDTEDTETE